MTTTRRPASTTRRELAFVLSVALCGVLLVTVVAFAPWYGTIMVV